VEDYEKNIALCYLSRDGDEHNKCELTDRRLLITRKNKLFEFRLNSIRFLAVNQRRLLIPIIFSGVFTPLIIVGFFKGIFHPLMALLFIVAGIFSFYIGWIGHEVLTVKQTSALTDIPVINPTLNLRAFMEYTNRYIQKEPIEYLLVYFLSEINGKSHPSKKDNLLDLDHELYSFYDLKEFLLSQPGKLNFLISGIDPLKAGSVIKYEQNMESQRLKPTIKGRINPDAIIHQYTPEEFLSIPAEK